MCSGRVEVKCLIRFPGRLAALMAVLENIQALRYVINFYPVFKMFLL